MTSRDPQRCCEAVRSAILAPVWLLVCRGQAYIWDWCHRRGLRDKSDSTDLSSTVDQHRSSMLLGDNFIIIIIIIKQENDYSEVRQQ